jgi:signal transduction histidine kinase
VRCDGEHVDISVTDDGTGFDAGSVVATGFGLTGMRERVELAGGELSVAPGLQGGTVIHARLPLDRAG